MACGLRSEVTSQEVVVVQWCSTTDRPWWYRLHNSTVHSFLIIFTHIFFYIRVCHVYLGCTCMMQCSIVFQCVCGSVVARDLHILIIFLRGNGWCLIYVKYSICFYFWETKIFEMRKSIKCTWLSIKIIPIPKPGVERTSVSVTSVDDIYQTMIASDNISILSTGFHVSNYGLLTLNTLIILWLLFKFLIGGPSPCSKFQYSPLQPYDSNIFHERLSFHLFSVMLCNKNHSLS